MAAETNIIEFPFVAGQNEGIDRTVLPVPQFSYLQNVRYRKGKRMGKRNGYTSVSSLDVSGAALGNGNGRLSCLGPNFCVVDDRFYPRDQVAGAWQGPPQSFETGAIAGTRLFGKFPQFMPGSVFEPLNVQSDLNLGGVAGTALPLVGGMTVAQGYVWTCCAYYVVADTTWLVRVVATDPTSGREVFQKDFDPGGGGTAPATVQQHPILLSTGNGTVVLIYDHFTAGVKDGVRVRTLTTIAGGFSAEVAFACISSAFNYDPSSSTGLLMVYTLTATPATLTIARMNPVTMVATASANYAPGGAKTLLSCFGNTAGTVWVGFTDAGVFTATFNVALVHQATTASFVGLFAANGAQGPIMYAERTATTVAALTQATAITGLNCIGVDSTGTLNDERITQYNASALSQPFTIGGQVFIWARHTADPQLGVATLLRVPLASEYSNNNISPYVRAWPIEATIDDRDIDTPIAAGVSGTTLSVPRLSSLGYVSLLLFTADSIVAGSTVLVRRFMVAPVRHRSEGVRYSPSCVLPVGGKWFVAGAQPMWVDQSGEYEAGFIQAPVSTAATIITAGGSLTINSAYSHTAIYESLDTNGLIERSAPAVPRACATTANQTATVEFSNLEFGQRWLRCKIYRTLANGSVFKLVGSIDASPAMAVSGVFTFVDTYADADITQNETLYTQIGQELATTQFPACSFAATGGGRMVCAGGFNGRVGHFSKLFTPHICPEFADDDAFRVTLPSDWTGAAYLDAWVGFTREGIYTINGDGPDGSGTGAFAPAFRQPYQLGCIDWRSVVACDIGVFFQSARGLELLPRGFGPPVSQDQVQDAIETYPIITSARAFYSSSTGEQVVRFTATASEAATSGVVLTYDLTYKTWQIDTYSADFPACFQAEWQGEPVLAPATTLVGAGGAPSWHPFRVQDTGFDDQGLAVPMLWRTGNVRPWGTFAHGVVNRVGLLGTLKSACTVSCTKTTDKGSRTTTRTYTGIAPDPLAGDEVYLEVILAQAEQRDVTFLRVEGSESSTGEGVNLIGMIIETDNKPQGFRLLGAADRIT